MNNTYYFIRHAHSNYTPDEINRPLSDKGRKSLAHLEFLSDKPIAAIYSSPYRRAIQTVEPLAQSLKLAIQTDKRLIERKLSSQAIADPDFEHASCNFGHSRHFHLSVASLINKLNSEP